MNIKVQPPDVYIVDPHLKALLENYIDNVDREFAHMDIYRLLFFVSAAVNVVALVLAILFRR